MKKLLLILTIAISSICKAQSPDVYGILNYSDSTGGIYRDVVNFTWEPIMTWTKARAAKVHTDTVDFVDCNVILFRKGILPHTDTCSTTSGAAVFYLTNDGTNSGTALYPNGNIWPQFIINDVSRVYAYSWVLSNSNRTLTVTVKYQDHDFMSGLYMTNAPNNTLVRMTITGN